VEPGPVTIDLDLAVPVDAADHTRGSDGRQLVVCGDFECPYTAAAMQSIGRMLESGAAFELVFRHFPLRGASAPSGTHRPPSETGQRAFAPAEPMSSGVLSPASRSRLLT
jgi:hypothetical protein